MFSPFLSLPVLLEVINFTFQRTIYLIFFPLVFLVSISFLLFALDLFCFSNFLRLRAWVTDFKSFLFSYNYLGPFVSANVLYSSLLLDSDQLKGMCVTPKEGRWQSQLLAQPCWNWVPKERFPWCLAGAGWVLTQNLLRPPFPFTLAKERLFLEFFLCCWLFRVGGFCSMLSRMHGRQ